MKLIKKKRARHGAAFYKAPKNWFIESILDALPALKILCHLFKFLSVNEFLLYFLDLHTSGINHNFSINHHPPTPSFPYWTVKLVKSRFLKPPFRPGHNNRLM